MKASSIYTRKTKGLDNGVWMLMIIMMILSLGLLSFMWFNNKKCLPFAVKISHNTDSVLYTGNTIYFDITIPAKNLDWDYGDGTDSKNELTGVHIYTKAGKYKVTATNSGCDEYKEIEILPNPNEDNSGASIEGPATIAAGTEVEYSCIKQANEYQWEVDNYTIKPKQSGNFGEKARFTFTQGGTYNIRVKLNGSRVYSCTRSITVTGGEAKKTKTEEVKKIPGLPPVVKDPQPEEKQVKGIGPKGFKEMLSNILEDNPKFTPEDFDAYLALGIDGTKVTVNGHPTKFRTMFTRISGNHGTMSVDDVQFSKDPDNDKIINIIMIKISNY